MKKTIDLTKLDRAFAQASTGLELVPDGSYRAQIENVELRHTRNSLRPMLSWTLRILNEQFAGRRLWRHQVLHASNLGWLKKDLHLCGVDLPKLSDLPAHLDRLKGICLEIFKRTRGDYQSIYFRRQIQP